MTPAPPVRASGPVTKPKVRVFAANGAFLRRATPEQAEHLIRTYQAEQRGRDLRMVYLATRRGLDGLCVIDHDARTEANVRGVWTFATRTLLEGGAR